MATAKKPPTIAAYSKFMDWLLKARMELDTHPERTQRNMAETRRRALKLGIDPDEPENLDDF